MSKKTHLGLIRTIALVIVGTFWLTKNANADWLSDQLKTVNQNWGSLIPHSRGDVFIPQGDILIIPLQPFNPSSGIVEPKPYCFGKPPPPPCPQK